MNNFKSIIFVVSIVSVNILTTCQRQMVGLVMTTDRHQAIKPNTAKQAIGFRKEAWIFIFSGLKSLCAIQIPLHGLDVICKVTVEIISPRKLLCFLGMGAQHGFLVACKCGHIKVRYA